MKNIINYFYGFEIDNLRMNDDKYYFSYEGYNFIFQQIKDNYVDYHSLYELNKILAKNNSLFFKIVINKNNQIITTVSSKKYILMSDNDLSDRELNFNDILDTNILVNNLPVQLNGLNKTNWNKLWRSKIDYFEMFINYNINKYPQLMKYYNYFIGLGENAILYVENALKEKEIYIDEHLVICHRRIEKGSVKQLFNPLSLVIDHYSRDIVEYLKMIFFSNQTKKDDIYNYLKNARFSKYTTKLIMARLLFPSHFFDLFENLIDNKEEEINLLKIVDMIDKYELFVYKIYQILKQKHNIPEIKWIKKVDYSSTLITPNTSGTSFTNIDSIPSFNVTSIMLQ